MRRAQARALAKIARATSSATIKPRVQKNVRPTFWERGEFVAIDGEGFSEGAEQEYIVGKNKTRYVGKEHFYAYLAASDGSSIYNPNGRLSLRDCLKFLCNIVVANPWAVLVAFGASYDVTQMVSYDLSRDDICKLISHGDNRGRVEVTDDEFIYLLEYRPRKVLTIQRWRIGERRWQRDAKGSLKATPHLTVRVWDVWGFFQESFAGVMKKWCPTDPDYQFIARMKGERSVFQRHELEEIKAYNAAELRVLVKVMNRVRDALNDVGVRITRWDGAGAVAAGMMQQHGVKKHKSELPDDVFHAARCAYSGGHIEACKVGYYRGDVHHYDITSAYPDQFRRLPSLKNGRWISGAGDPPPGHTVVKVSFRFPDGLPFYPLFYREESGAILYPQVGSGHYWFPEFAAAKLFVEKFGGRLDVLQWWNFEPQGETVRPFQWIEEYFTKRAWHISEAKKRGLVSGPEKILKLGPNSCYGKTVQQVGARIDKEGNLRLPPFFQLDWGGYVPSGTRAQLMLAAMQKPNAVIKFATDGLFTTEALDLDCPPEKELGAWEYKLHKGITVAMPGVYWLHDDDETEHHSRGFDKKEMSDAGFVHEAWRRKKDAVAIKLTRLVGLGSAVTSEEFWKMRGRFMETTRTLCLDGDNSKRYPINLNRDKPHLQLVPTTPRGQFLPSLIPDMEIDESAPYPIAWIDGKVERDMLEGEMADELEALDAALS